MTRDQLARNYDTQMRIIFGLKALKAYYSLLDGFNSKELDTSPQADDTQSDVNTVHIRHATPPASPGPSDTSELVDSNSVMDN